MCRSVPWQQPRIVSYGTLSTNQKLKLRHKHVLLAPKADSSGTKLDRILILYLNIKSNSLSLILSVWPKHDRKVGLCAGGQGLFSKSPILQRSGWHITWKSQFGIRYSMYRICETNGVAKHIPPGYGLAHANLLVQSMSPTVMLTTNMCIVSPVRRWSRMAQKMAARVRD